MEAIELQDRDSAALVQYARAFTTAKETLEAAHRNIMLIRAANKESYAGRPLARADKICTKLLAAFDETTRPEETVA